jgi:hypothetical protein
VITLPGDRAADTRARRRGGHHVTGARPAGTIGRVSAPGEYEYAPLRIPAGTSRSAAAQLMSLQSDTGGWELARLQLHADGTRKVIMRRRMRLSYLPRPMV